MKERLIAGIDLGSSCIRLAIGQVVSQQDRREFLNIVGAVEVPSAGIAKGSISSLEDAVSSISACLEQAERQIGLAVTDAYVGIGSPFTTVQLAKGIIGVSHPDGEIRDEDVHRAVESARSALNPANNEVLHILPRGFTVDGQQGVKDPIGMQGIRLEVDAHIIQGMASHVRNLTKAVFRTGMDVTELVYAPLATAEAMTNARQRELGVAVVNLGASTTSLIMFEEGNLLSATIFPVGSDHITSDIAIGLRTGLDIADTFKKEHLVLGMERHQKQDELDLQDLGASQSERVSRGFVSDIATARVEEIFERVEKELRRMDRSGMLPAGVVLTGAGVKLPEIVDIAKRILRLPVSIGNSMHLSSPLVEVLQDPAFSTALGLVIWGFENERTQVGEGKGLFGGKGKKSGEWLKKTSLSIKRLFRLFVP